MKIKMFRSLGQFPLKDQEVAEEAFGRLGMPQADPGIRGPAVALNHPPPPADR